MKRLNILLLCAVLAGALFGCAQKEEGVTRLVLDWTPNTNHTGFYVARELGYYAEEGLEVEIMQPPEDGALALLAAGNAEFAVGFQESMGPAIANENPLPVEAVAAMISHNTSGVISLKETGIESPRDLAGKRFATWGTPLVDAVMRSVVEADGGVFEEIVMVPNSVTDVVSALQSDIDAVWVYYAWDGIATEINGIETNYFDFGTENPVLDFYTPVIVTNSDYARENPEQVRKFLAATERGYHYAMEQPEEAARILCEAAPELDEVLVTASQLWLQDQYEADAPYWGYIDSARWERFYRWMYEEELLDSDIGGAGFTNEYLPGAAQ